MARKPTQGRLICQALWAAARHGDISAYTTFHRVDPRVTDGWACITQLCDVVGYKATSRMTEARRLAAQQGYRIASRTCEDPSHHHESKMLQHRLEKLSLVTV